MRSNRRVDTRPERALRSALHARGFRFRKDYGVVAGSRRVRVDVAFTRARVAVFMDGCFWHRCPEHGSSPKHNGEFWAAKLDRNVERDRLVDRGLSESGWTVVRCWEHESIESAVIKVMRTLACRGPSLRGR